MLATKNIQDYYQINHRLASSGQPTPEQFAAIADAEYQIIVNLATSSSTNALLNQGAIVTDLGMIYLQIPVIVMLPSDAIQGDRF